MLLVDTTDIATNTNQAGFSLTQRLYMRPTTQQALRHAEYDKPSGECPAKPREWASWQIAQKSSSIPTSAARSSPTGATSLTPRST